MPLTQPIQYPLRSYEKHSTHLCLYLFHTRLIWDSGTGEPRRYGFGVLDTINIGLKSLSVNLSTDRKHRVARWKEAAEMRSTGKTYREIGKRLGVTAERARHIVARYNYEAINGKFLSVRATNVLATIFSLSPQSVDDLSPAQIAEVTAIQILKTQGAGRKTLAEIRQYLNDRGFELRDYSKWAMGTGAL